MAYLDRFQRYGSPSDQAEIKLYSHFMRPDTLTADRIAQYDKSAGRLIAEVQELISDLAEYRQALAARYAELTIMPSKPELKLERRKDSYNGGRVFYYITITNVFEDGTTTEELRETYAGTERHEAIKRYGELLKQRPGITAEKKIEKSKWER